MTIFWLCLCDVAYGPAVIEHSLLMFDFPPNSKIGKDVDTEKGLFLNLNVYSDNNNSRTMKTWMSSHHDIYF